MHSIMDYDAHLDKASVSLHVDDRRNVIVQLSGVGARLERVIVLSKEGPRLHSSEPSRHHV